MSAGRCETCAHWDRDADADDYERPMGTCKRIPHRDDRSPDDRAWVEDAEQYAALLRVRHDFGCIEHEPLAPGLSGQGMKP